MTTLDITNYRTWPTADRIQFANAYSKAMGNKLQGGTRVARVLLDIEAALLAAPTDTVNIDLTGLRLQELTQVVYALRSFGVAAPIQSPAPFLTAFVDSMKAASSDLVTQIRADGKTA